MKSGLIGTQKVYYDNSIWYLVVISIDISTIKFHVVYKFDNNIELLENAGNTIFKN